MSTIRQLLGLSFFKREPWRFPESKASGKSGVVVGNSRILRRENITSSTSFVIDKEVIAGTLFNRTEPDLDDSGEKIPLHVKLRGEQSSTKTIISRRRSLTRLSSASSSSRLTNVFCLRGNINSEQALSVGYAAVELGVKYLRIDAPSGRDAVEQLRIVKTIASRFNLLLVIHVSNVEDFDFCLNWANVLEVEIVKDPTKRELLRRAVNSDKILALKRSPNVTLEEFVRVTSAIQLESAKEFIIVESGSAGGVPSFNVGMIQRLKEKTGSDVILDLSQSGSEVALNVQLSGVASGANGLVLQFDHTNATESFEELQSVTQKLEAVKYTLDAISQIN